jgi:hypothetical protein
MGKGSMTVSVTEAAKMIELGIWEPLAGETGDGTREEIGT